VARVTFSDSNSAPVVFQNFWIRVRQFFKFENPTPVQTPATIIDPTVFYPYFYYINDQKDSCYCRHWKVTLDPGPVFPKFSLRIRVRKKNAESYRSRLRHSGSGPTSVSRMVEYAYRMQTHFEKKAKPPETSDEQIGDFCNPNPVQNFHWVFRSDPNPVDLSKHLIQSGLYPKNPLIKHFTAVINAVWISISDPIEFFRNPVRSGSASELQNPVGSRFGNRIMFNTARTHVYKKPNRVKKAKLLHNIKFLPFPCVTVISPRWSTEHCDWLCLGQSEIQPISMPHFCCLKS